MAGRPGSAAQIWVTAAGDRRGPGLQHLLAFLLLTLLGSIVGTLGLVGLPVGSQLSFFWLAMTLQVVGGVWFGGWGVLAGSLVGVFSNYFNMDIAAYTWGYLPANLFQSFLTAWVFRTWKLDIRLPTWKELAIFCVVAALLSNVGGALLAAAALYLFDVLPDPKNPARFLAEWILGNGLPCLIFGPLLMRAFSPQIAGSPFLCKRWWGGSAPMRWPGWRFRNFPIAVRLLISFGLAGVLPILAVCVVETVQLKSKDPQHHSHAFAFLLSVSIFLSIIVAGLVAGAMQRRIGALAEAAHRFGEGELGYRVPDLGANELGRLGETFNQMAQDLVSSQEQLKHNAEEQARSHRELEIAQEIQQGFLPQEYPNISGVEVAAKSLPARVVGGDFYDFIPLNEGRWGFLIADVSGKGVPAALFTGLTRSLVRMYAAQSPDLASCLGAVNASILTENPAGMFVTLFVAAFEPATLKLTYVNAGHNPPLLVRGRSGDMERLGATGVPLALLPEASYKEREARMEQGDTLVLYTDGVTEAFNPKGDMFGDERLAAVARSGAETSARRCLDSVLAAVSAFAEDAPQSDDITVVVVKSLSEPRQAEKEGPV